MPLGLPARSGRYQASRSFQANDMPTSLAQRGQTLVVSVSNENDFCSAELGKESLERLGGIDQVRGKQGGEGRGERGEGGREGGGFPSPL